jgi:hypothetical protein
VVFALLLLVHLSAVFDKHPGANNPFAAEDVERGTTIENGIMPLEFFCLTYLFLFKVYDPIRKRRKYRKDPSQRGENVVQLGPNGLSEVSSTGSTSSRAWTVCSCWRESKRVIVLKTQSGIFYIFPKACLSTEQQNELRGILAVALPKK